MRIFTEVVGGPNHGDLVQVHGDTFSALEFKALDIATNWQQIVEPSTRQEFNEVLYRKSKAFFVFDNKYYFREFFTCNSKDQDRAIKSFMDYFNPVFKK